MCYPLDDNVDLSLAALIEPLAVARHAVKTSGFDDFSNLLLADPVMDFTDDVLAVRATWGL